MRPERAIICSAVLLVALAAGTPGASAQTAPGLSCDADTPAPGDTLSCDAGFVEPGTTYTAVATFAGGTEITASGAVSNFGDATFEFTVPDEPGEFSVVFDNDGEKWPTADYTFSGTVQAEEDEPAPPTTQASDPDPTTTTAQVGAVPVGGVETGRGPGGGFATLLAAALALGTGSLLVVRQRRPRRAGRGAT